MDERLAAGDLEGQREWIRIRQAIKALQGDAPNYPERPPGVPSQREPYQVASVLITHYGADALEIATKRAEALTGQNDTDGAATWLGVVRAVKALTSTMPEGPTH